VIQEESGTRVALKSVFAATPDRQLVEGNSVAEIPIQRKPRSRLAPLLLVLLIIIVIAVGWYLWSNSQNTSTSTTKVGSGAAADVVASTFAERIYG